MSHYSWIKESRTLDRKLNGKKTSEIKKFYWERDVFKPSKAKNVVVLVYLAFLTGSLPVKNWKITEINLYLF